MSTKRILWINVLIGVCALIVILVLARGLKIDQTKIPSELVGKAATDFAAGWVQGEEHLPKALSKEVFKLSEFSGRIIVLNFWASWCVSCREEALELEAFWQSVKSAGEIAVLGIAIQDTKDAALGFAKQFGKTYILGLDFEGRISIDYGVTGVPETFIINKKGIIVHKETGPVTKRDLEKLVKLAD